MSKWPSQSLDRWVYQATSRDNPNSVYRALLDYGTDYSEEAPEALILASQILKENPHG